MWVVNCLLQFVRSVNSSFLNWMNAGAPDGILEVRMYDIHEMRRVVLFKMTLLFRLHSLLVRAVYGRVWSSSDVLEHCLQKLPSRGTSHSIFVCVSRKGHAFGDDVQTILSCEQVTTCGYKVATIVPFLDVSYTYNTVVRGTSPESQCKLNPATLLILAYLDGRVSIKQVVRFVQKAPVSLDVLSLETLESRRFAPEEPIIDTT